MKKVFNEKLIKTDLTREDLKQLLELCTKEMHFTYDNKLYRQVNGVSMGSCLGPIFANIFMVELERDVVPRLNTIMPLWKRYVDDTFTFVKKNEIAKVKSLLNTFHPDIKFTHEIQNDNKISFLDVLLTRTGSGTINTSVYRKPTNNNIYIHWDSYSPKQWKIGTLSGIIRRAYEICSTKEALVSELNFILKIFTEINGYPYKLVQNMLVKFENTFKTDGLVTSKEEALSENNNTTDQNNNTPMCILNVPYRGKKGESMMKSFTKTLDKSLPKEINYRIVNTGTKLSRHFSLKDKVDEKHLSNYVYSYECSKKVKCKDNYVGETGRRKIKRIREHAGNDKNSAIYKHSKMNKHTIVKEEDFHVLAANYPNRRKRKLAESMFIRDLKPTLNKQIDSFKLALFV